MVESKLDDSFRAVFFLIIICTKLVNIKALKLLGHQSTQWQDHQWQYHDWSVDFVRSWKQSVQVPSEDQQDYQWKDREW